MDFIEPPPLPTRNTSVRFTGENATFRRLVVRGSLLELITFGFYRFWLTTDMRRHLWSNTEVDGDAMEYTGRGKELLFGFIFALAVLLPVFFVYTLAGIAAERYKTLASLPLYACLFMFGQFAVFRARRYRLTRTVWRGVRFWMTGSGWVYAIRSVAWLTLVIATLGFAYPWQMASLERYKFRHTHYGSLPARFEATGVQLFRQVWWVWLLGLLSPIMLLGGGIVAVVLKHRGFDANSVPMMITGFDLLTGFFLLTGVPFFHATRKAIEWRWWASGIRFGGAAVRCILPAADLVGVYWTMIGTMLLVLAAFGFIGATIVGSIFLVFRPAGTIASAILHLPPSVLIGDAVWYITLILTLSVLFRIFLLQRVWKRVVAGCTLQNADAVADVTAAGEAASALGEGLVDGLDFAGF